MERVGMLAPLFRGRRPPNPCGPGPRDPQIGNVQAITPVRPPAESNSISAQYIAAPPAVRSISQARKPHPAMSYLCPACDEQLADWRLGLPWFPHSRETLLLITIHVREQKKKVLRSSVRQGLPCRERHGKGPTWVPRLDRVRSMGELEYSGRGLLLIKGRQPLRPYDDAWIWSHRLT
ncbi:hypothetical protein VUR80DRAFT_7318 [Thermomyces stellatus]